MRNRSFLALALATFAALAIAACGDTTINIGGPSQVVGGGGNGGPSPSPSASPSGTGSFAYVRAGFYGIAPETDPVCAAVRNSEGRLPMQCRGAATATPKNPDGSDASPAQHGPNCSWYLAFPSDAITFTQQSNPFNVDVRPLRAGRARLCARVLDKEGCFDISVEP